MTPNQEAKLPKHVQTELQVLRSQVEHWKRKAMEVATAAGTSVELQTYGEGPSRFLPEGSAVLFHAAAASKFAAVNRHRWNVRLGGLIGQDPPAGSLIVSYDHQLYVEPRSSNLVWLHPAPMP